MKPLKKFNKDDYFKIDVECHIGPSIKPLEYLLEYRKQSKAYSPRALGMERLDVPPQPPLTERDTTVESLIACMDKYGIDMACAMREDMRYWTGGVAPLGLNSYIIEANKKYPDRLIPTFDLSPIIGRDMGHVLWELEYLVKEHNCKAVGEFCPFTEKACINDRRFWPFYTKLVDFGVVLIVHTGMNWVWGHSYTCHPQLLEDVAEEFPDLKIVALHCGWPYHHDLNLIAASYSNIYISLSFLCPWGITAPRRFAKLVGEALQFVGSGRIVWGTDSFGTEARTRLGVQGLSQFEITEELQDDYGFPPLTDEDKHKIFGLNLAKLFGVEPKRQVKV